MLCMNRYFQMNIALYKLKQKIMCVEGIKRVKWVNLSVGGKLFRARR